MDWAFLKARKAKKPATAARPNTNAGCRRDGREVVVYLSIDQPFTEPILRDYERQSGVKVRAVFDTEETKSTGVVNRLIAEAQAGNSPRRLHCTFHPSISTSTSS